MKVRNGFVSNSSSSSFVIDFHKGEITEEDVKDYLLSLNCNYTNIDFTVSRFMKLVNKVYLPYYEEKLEDYKKSIKKENDAWMKSYYNERIEKFKNIISKIKKSGNTLFEITLSDHSDDEDYIPANEDEYECLEFILQCSGNVFEEFNNH